MLGFGGGGSSGGDGVTVPLLLDSPAPDDLLVSFGTTGDDASTGLHADGSLRAAHGYMLIPDVHQDTGALGLYPIGGSEFAYLFIYNNEHDPNGSPNNHSGDAPFAEHGPSVLNLAHHGDPASQLLATSGNAATNGAKYPKLFMDAEDDLGGQDATLYALHLYGAHGQFKLAWDFGLRWTGAASQTLKPTTTAGVLEIAEHGGGDRRTSPDGLVTRTITLANDGSWVTS